MNIVKITDIVNEITETPKYILTELTVADIKGIIAAFQKFITFYTDYGEYCNVSKDMIIYLLTVFCGCQLISDKDVDMATRTSELYNKYIDDIDIDNWIDIT